MVTHPSKEKLTTEKQPETPDPPLPPLPPTDNPRDSTLIRTEPPQIVDPSDTVAIQGEVINDRTAQQEQEDNDVVMSDPPPEEPPKSETPQVNLPPPPPRNGQVSTEPQKFLLPPLQSQFKGRKCLVLDLDETLVHSSFKVS